MEGDQTPPVRREYQPRGVLPADETATDEMVERVARAMVRVFECRWEGLNGVQQEMALTRARAAIRAMRVPTEAMIQAGMNAGSIPLARGEVETRYVAMIDEALR